MMACISRNQSPLLKLVKQKIVVFDEVYTGLFKVTIGLLTTCHTHYTSDSSMQLHRWIKKFSEFSFVIFGVQQLCISPIGAQFTKMTANGREKAFCVERTRLSCWCLQNHKGCTYRAPVRYVTKTWRVILLNKKIHILPSQMYCVYQVVKTPTIILNNPVYSLP